MQTASSKTEHKKLYQVPDIVPKQNAFYSFIKRLFDIVFSFTALCFCIVPMLIIAVFIVIDSPGKVFYLQERLGKNGKPFMLIKFRSMIANAEEDGAQWAQEDDPRCTRVGRFLRASRLDELPQFLNILLGQMSFVGPRPERKCFYDEFEKTIHGFSYRLRVTPGLTGLAQVNGGYDLLPEEKIVYDMDYIATRSLLLDAKCILKTVLVVFNHNGAR